MAASLTPRDIQSKIRSGESLTDVIAESGLPADRVEAFAGPILAEREHITATAMSSPIRRRGEVASTRRLQQTVAESMLDQGQDIDLVSWDSWRRSDGRWVVEGDWSIDGQARQARFVFDAKARFSTADNDQARLLVGDLPLISSSDPESEPTVEVLVDQMDFSTDLADESTIGVAYATLDEPTTDFAEIVDSGEDSFRSDIDMLYDMIATIDEDSVRIFRSLRDPLPHSEPSLSVPEEPSSRRRAEQPAPGEVDQPGSQASIEVTRPPTDGDGVEQPSLLGDEPSVAPSGDDSRRRSRHHKRASVPSWDDIIFGGRS
jgi:hypothetical protein